jgi:CubicO group peptidase (beta-lactamase class C family)
MKQRFIGGCAWGALLVLILPFAPWWTHPAPAQDVSPGTFGTALGKLDDLAPQILARTGVPGIAIAVVHQDAVVYLKGFGVREVGTDEPVDADTVFQLASVSKPIASTVVAALVGDGVVNWDDRIVDHDPGFQMYDPWVTRAVTLRDMFAHRSGLPGFAGDLLEDLGYDREAVLYRLRYQHPASSFRSRYAYTNFGLTEAAVAAARAAGKSWEEIAAERLYQPLGMRSTSSRYADFVAARNRAHGHVRVDGAWVARYQRDPDAQSPAGGVSSTVRDLAQWMRLQLGNGQLDGVQLIAAEALAETHRPQIVSRPPLNPAIDQAGFYGLGWNVGYDEQGRVRLSHSGGFLLGAGTVVMLLPSESLGIAVLTNAAPIGVAEAVGASFFDLVLRGTVERDWLAYLQPLFATMFEPAYGRATDYAQPPARPAPALPFAAYLGTYGNVYFGEIEVGATDEGLVLQLGPAKTPFALRHWDRDVFLYQPTGENAAGLSGVAFSIGPDQKATSVTIENLDIYGEGTFARLPPST